MPKTLVVGLAISASVACLAGAQEPPTRWSAGVAWQGRVPGDRALGLHIARVIATPSFASVRLEAAGFATIGKQVISVCPSSTDASCEGKSVDRVGELLATFSIGETTGRSRSLPVLILGTGAYVSRRNQHWDGDASTPTGGMIEGGLGFALSRGVARTRLEATVRRYYGLQSSWGSSSLNVRLSHHW